VSESCACAACRRREESSGRAAPDPLVAILLRLSPRHAEMLDALVRETRVRKADYLREAVADLLRKYGRLPPKGDRG
jgi:hypothetical protein